MPCCRTQCPDTLSITSRIPAGTAHAILTARVPGLAGLFPPRHLHDIPVAGQVGNQEHPPDGDYVGVGQLVGGGDEIEQRRVTAEPLRNRRQRVACLNLVLPAHLRLHSVLIIGGVLPEMDGCASFRLAASVASTDASGA
jgi:hypothetical protein